ALYCIFTLILVSLGRALLRFSLRLMRKKGYNKKFVLLIGFTEQGKAYLDAISKHKEMGYTAIGIMDDAQNEYKNVPYLGRIDALSTVLEIHTVDEVVIAVPLDKYSALPEILETCENAGVKSVIIPAYADYIPAKPQMDEIDSVHLINTRYIPLDNMLFAAFKYGFDFVLSLIMCIVLSPVLLVCAALVKLSSKGPVLYTQERIGYNKKPFKIYKFRTMFSDAPEGWTIKDDPRVTPIGKFLRKTSLDELPQLFNVLKGEMSLVGPRPEQTVYVEQFKNEIPKYMLKHRVRPGITGLAQVKGFRGDTSIKERIRYDILYIENWSPFLDLKIMILTLFNREGY
ncbi:MAG: undecaprenyl-phosphate glucose phosphotransferase, partial [Clostridia bacterium]|nr:undecaprenyl-phosphate glucose phosphotransferase [Clostridia bacterium]